MTKGFDYTTRLFLLNTFAILASCASPQARWVRVDGSEVDQANVRASLEACYFRQNIRYAESLEDGAEMLVRRMASDSSDALARRNKEEAAEVKVATFNCMREHGLVQADSSPEAGNPSAPQADP